MEDSDEQRTLMPGAAIEAMHGSALQAATVSSAGCETDERLIMSQAKPIVIGHWAARLITAGILLMGAMPKFTGGAAELVEKLPGGNAAAISIGVAEIIAVVLMFIPKTTFVGSGLAAVIMLGAVASHIVGPVGMEGDMATMVVLAGIALVAAAAATVLAQRRGMGLLPGSSASATS